VAEQRYAITSIHDNWTLGGEPIEVTLLRLPEAAPIHWSSICPG